MKKQNIKIISLLVSIIGLLCLLIGSSFALLQNKNEGNKEVINVGKVKLILNITNDEFILNNSSYLTDKDAFINSEFYSFNISNVGDTPAEYDLLLVSDTTKENTLDEKYIKVGLEVNGETIIVNLKEVNNIIHSTVINKNEDIEYKLILWTDLNNLDDETILEGTTLNLKLKVNATQYMGESNTKNTFYNIMKNEVKTTNISYKYINNANITENGITYNNNDNGVFLYNGTDDNNGSLPIYYYRGNVNNNNVLFANMCWKIVRTTSTGGTKLIYNGVPTNGTCNNTGEDSQIGTSAFNENYNSPAYIGYMYGTGYERQYKDMSIVTDAIIYGNDVTYSNGTYTLKTTKTSTSWTSDYQILANKYHYTCFTDGTTCTSVYYITYFNLSYADYLSFTGGDTLDSAKEKMYINTNDSTIKTYIDNWYKENLTNYTNYLENTIFCNDRSSASDEAYTVIRWGISYTENGGALSSKDTNAIDFPVFKSFENTSKGTPSLECKNTDDQFSLRTDSGGTKGYGNTALKYPIGLLTLDEAELTGAQYDLNGNANYYLYIGQNYWLMSPVDWARGYSGVGIVRQSGSIYSHHTDTLNGIRPVISLKQGTIILQGSGLSSDPYVVTK